MVIDKNGNIKEIASTNYKKLSNTKKTFDKAKEISSIFIDNAVKVDSGYLFTRENMSTTVNQLIKYLKNNS